MKTMTTSCDRTRLKDRILANVAKAIKCIQEFHILKGEENLVLTNSDWQCHKLCEHLDHAFLHGLRHVTHGYWKVVTDFTRKGAVQEIVRLSHVTTDLGRGRAWLYIALNENLLESYMRCFMENSRYVKKYYVKEALVLDQQRLNVLVTLTSGLDFGTFKLEYDMPYLDLSSYQARPKTDQSSAAHIDDKVSLCSMESSSSLLSSSMSSSLMSSSDYLFPRGYGDEDFGRRRTYSASTDSGFQIEAGSTLLSSRHLSVPCDSSMRSSSPHSDTFTRISRIESIVNVSDQEDSENLEVIRIRSKGDHSKKKKKKLKKLTKKDKNSISERDEGEVTDSNSLSRDDSTEDTSRATPSDDGNSENFYNHGTNTSLHSPTPLGKVTKDDSGYGLCEDAMSVGDDTDSGIYHHNKVTVVGGKPNLSSEQFKTMTESHGDIPKPNLPAKFSNHDDHPSAVSPTRKTDSQTANDKVNNPLLSGSHSISLTSPELQVKSVESPSQAGNSSHNVKLGLIDTTALGNHVGCSVNSETVKETPVSSNDIYGGSVSKGQGSTLKPRSNTADELSSKVLETLAKAESEKELENSHQSSVIESGEEQKDKPSEEDLEFDYSVKVDNNTMLHLMLDVFEKEEEQFIKLFSTRSGHTEGETTLIALLVTDKAVYLLSRTHGGTLKKVASIPYQELDYISLSIGDQVVQIVCTNRRKQFWVTTGDSALTKCVLQSVCEAMELSPLKLPKLSVLTDATTQRIAMTKYAAAETNSERENVKILSYVLVHWEDPSSSRKQQSAHKEGHLLYKSKGLNFTWKTAYVALRDGVFCLFNSKSDSKPQQFIKLNSENCSGCRRLTSTDRSHCLEIMGTKGNGIQLAAANDQEASSWLQVLCQAVSEGQQCIMGEGRSLNCLACCLILTPQKILMCHEDVQTSFFRTLGSANVVDVTAITEDPFVKTYCVLEFESQDVGISSNQWVLYFNAANEKKAFIQAFSGEWAKEFQVEVPIHQIQDVPLQTKCREMANHLRDSLKLK